MTLLFGNVLQTPCGERYAVYRLPPVSYPHLPAREKLQLHESVASSLMRIGCDIRIHRIATQAAPLALLAVRAGEAATRGVALDLESLQLHAAKLAARPVPVAQAQRATPAQVRALAACLAPDASTVVASYDDASGDVTWLAPQHGGLQEHADRLVVGGEHVAHLVLGDPPGELSLPGDELTPRACELQGVRCDVHIHARHVPNIKAMAFARRRLVDADNAALELQLACRRTDSAVESSAAAAMRLKAYLESDAVPPVWWVRTVLVVRAYDPEALDCAVARVRAACPRLQLHCPRYAQRRLHELVAGYVSGRDFERLMTSEQLAATMPHASEHAGNAGGLQLGRIVRSGRPVWLDTAAAARHGRPPTMLLVGTLGSGKTMTAQTIAWHAARSGSRVIDIDPKPDHNLDKLEDLHDQVELVELSDLDRCAGTLDPMRTHTGPLRTELATAALLALVGCRDATTSAAIRRAISTCTETHACTSQDVIEALARDTTTHARQVGEQLATWSDSALGRLLIARPGDRTLDLSRKVTQLRCQSLELPSHGTCAADLNDGERISLAVLDQLAHLATSLARSTGAPSLVLVDEAWALLSSRAGRSLVERIARTGRSANQTLVLATQQLVDARDLTELIGTFLAFGQQTAHEACSTLALLGMDPSEDNVRLLRSLRSGACLMRDTHDRIAHLQVTPPPQLLTALDTTPAGHTEAA